MFTAAADILLGFLLTNESLRPPTVFAALMTSSLFIYMAGMVLNDVFDFAADARLRPGRPLPSGRVSRSTAVYFGLTLLGLGVAASWLAAGLIGSVRPGIVGSALALLVFSYDAVLKQTPAAPLGMGGCRSLNVLLGMSAGGAWSLPHFVVACGIGIYICGVTWFARREAQISHRGHLTAATLTLLAGIAVLMLFPLVALADNAPLRPFDDSSAVRSLILLAVLGAIIARRCLIAIACPLPDRVQAAVKLCILSLVLLDATLCFVVQGPFWAVVIAFLLAPTILLGHWFYST